MSRDETLTIPEKVLEDLKDNYDIREFRADAGSLHHLAIILARELEDETLVTILQDWSMDKHGQLVTAERMFDLLYILITYNFNGGYDWI